MGFELEVIDSFKRQAKRLLKKFPSLRDEVEALGMSLQGDPFQGTPLANSFYKIRLAIKSKGTGKRGGARVITCVKPAIST